MPKQYACHKVYEIKYHIVLVVKYRKDLFLSDDCVSFLKQTLTEIQKRYYLETESIGFDQDHVHILACAAPRYSPSKIISIVKSITARRLFATFPEIKKDLWGGEFWSDGGYIGTVGEGANADVIRRYIQRQGIKSGQLRIIDFTAEP
jgi:putative transposase